MDKEALRKLAEAAVQCERETGYPAEVILAQAALETGWLRNVHGNNLFGIKYSPLRGGGRQLLRTSEWFTEEEAERWLHGMEGRQILSVGDYVDPRGKRLYRVRDWFVVYPDLASSMRDYVRLVTSGRYAGAWKRYLKDKDIKGLVRGIADAGYSTRKNYADLVLGVLTPEVMDAIRAARGQAGR